MPSRSNRDSRVTVQEEVTPVLAIWLAYARCWVLLYSVLFHWCSLCGGSIYFVLTVTFYIRFSFVINIGTLESMVYGQSSHITHTGGTFGTRQFLWLVTKYFVLPAQTFTFCTAYYNVLSDVNFYVRVVTTRLLHIVNTTNKEAPKRDRS